MFLALFINPNAQTASVSSAIFTISPDRTEYSVHEPVTLALKVKNISNHKISGRFALSLRLPELDIYYRRVGNNFNKYSCGWKDMPNGGSTIPTQLNPNEEFVRFEIVAFDTKDSQFIADCKRVQAGYAKIKK